MSVTFRFVISSRLQKYLKRLFDAPCIDDVAERLPLKDFEI